MAIDRTLPSQPVPGRAPIRLAPTPPGHPLLGNTPEFWRDTLQAFTNAWHAHGDIVRLRFGGPLVAHMLIHPDYVKHVLQERHQVYRKAPRHVAKLKPMIGLGLLTSDGDYWLRQRRLAQPAFHRARIAALGDLMTESTARMLERWHRDYASGRPFDAAAEMMRLTLEIVGKALFGADVSEDADEVGRAVTIALEDANQRLRSYVVLPDWLPTPGKQKFRHARATLDQIVYRIIEERRSRPKDRDDLLAMLLEAQDEETGQRMTDVQLRDEVMTLFLAGHETTANALSWTWYLLSTHPAVRERLQEEVRTVLKGRAPTVDDLPQLPYSRMVLEESMRLYPPAWTMSRAPIADDEIAGYHIPKGWPVFLLPYLTHRHPEFWENPEGFDPERFSSERSAGRPRFAYFPFGGGPRQCIGNAFAMMEAQLILTMVAQHYRLDLVPGHPIELQPLITLRPKHGIRVTLAKA